MKQDTNEGQHHLVRSPFAGCTASTAERFMPCMISLQDSVQYADVALDDGPKCYCTGNQMDINQGQSNGACRF
ncbi:hypothetical protein D3871_25985 [Noviherbaspirillum saxi]|uniref:Uncharacterized protein n=1 Tax=Noviherbaspirillum saxi TaxID=2320863 RepID=A0A3A3FYD7_9BURK|nr:hypothetical protein D3871_25985 [Noviherbaspirillum saxi]